MTTDNKHKKIGEVLLCGFRVMRIDKTDSRQTDRQKDKRTYSSQ